MLPMVMVQAMAPMEIGHFAMSYSYLGKRAECIFLKALQMHFIKMNVMDLRQEADNPQKKNRKC
jgi:hypothetical protein